MAGAALIAHARSNGFGDRGNSTCGKSTPLVNKPREEKQLRHTSATNSRIVLYPDDLYEGGGQLFCCVCCHTIDRVRKNTIDEHMKSRKQCERKAAAIKKKGRWIWTSETTCFDNLLL
eukprot:gi/632973594/ref/XP_007903228.1/ PREDICTED: LOW QUALITY PROTEIN: CGG triplet repeat-binding protein 1 [Callorhinchus milii]